MIENHHFQLPVKDVLKEELRRKCINPDRSSSNNNSPGEVMIAS